MRQLHFAWTARTAAVIAFTAIVLSAADDTYTRRRTAPPEALTIQPGWTTDDPMHAGRPLSHWVKIIRRRNQELMPLAFDAIREMGPDAWPAIPELTRVITAPFTPIRVGKDSDELIAEKMYDMQIRAEAIDALVFIGEEAASATVSLVQWALVVRVTSPMTVNRDDYNLFIDLMTIDTEQRMQVVDAITTFGDAATPTVERLLRSPDAATRKLSVVILGGDAVLRAADLLKSPDCEDRNLGFTILTDMDLIVAKEHLSGLRHTLTCDAN
jgi:hypothetical protein